MSRASGTRQVTTSNFDISVLIGSKVSNAQVATGSCANNSKAVTSGSGIPYTTSVNVNSMVINRVGSCALCELLKDCLTQTRRILEDRFRSGSPRFS